MPEWLEPDGTGGFASGTTDLVRTRRYHALLLTQSNEGRHVLVNGLEAWLEIPGLPVIPITTQHYAPDITAPPIAPPRFAAEPWPTWTHALPAGTLTHDLFVAGGQTNLRWTWSGPPAILNVRLLLSGRDYHGLHHENPAFDVAHAAGPGWTRWRPYPGRAITAWGGDYTPAPDWYRRFRYAEETARGLDDTEDLASPGILRWDLARPATLALRADDAPAWPIPILASAEAAERRTIPPRHRAARAYVVRPPGRTTIIAGYPWFTDWGRDTFIAIRGLLLQASPAPGGHANRQTAEQILQAWAATISEGMLPNRFPDGNGAPEYNAVDASLWFVVAVHDLLEHGAADPAPLRAACHAILAGYRAGTRYGIAMDTDGLIRAGVPGVQLTWMDAKVGDWVVTPRIGKPVEVQALWINALRIAGAWPGGEAWPALADQATATLLARFPHPEGGLLDLVDGDPVEQHRIRPNQIFAAGGLPHAVLPPGPARAVVDLVEARLLTPLGLRTLDPGDPAYRPRYQGGPLERDGAYHQGTAWPWLLGPFVQAWLHVRGNTAEARAEARTRFLPPLHEHLTQAGLGHVSEVVDAEAPHHPGGCPFQAWSLGELLRIEALVGTP